MRSFIASLRVLVLPFGATTGGRIILNGIAGLIELYNSLGQLYGSIAPASGFTAFDPATPARFVRLTTDAVEGPIIDFGQDDASIDLQGYLQQYIAGAGGTRNLVMELSPGRFTSSTDCRLLLTSESENGTELPLVEIIAAALRIMPSTGSVTDFPRFAVWTATGTLDAGGNFTIAGTPVTSANVLTIEARYLDGANQSLAFGGGVGPVVQSTGTIFDISGTGGANRPYRVTALYTP